VRPCLFGCGWGRSARACPCVFRHHCRTRHNQGQRQDRNRKKPHKPKSVFRDGGRASRRRISCRKRACACLWGTKSGLRVCPGFPKSRSRGMSGPSRPTSRSAICQKLQHPAWRGLPFSVVVPLHSSVGRTLPDTYAQSQFLQCKMRLANARRLPTA